MASSVRIISLIMDLTPQGTKASILGIKRGFAHVQRLRRRPFPEPRISPGIP